MEFDARLKTLKKSIKTKKQKKKPQIVDDKTYFEALCRGEFVNAKKNYKS
jgi:predicted nucleic acid-binding protein